MAGTEIAIVGMGCLFPQADGVAAFWERVRRGADAIGAVPATHWRPEDFYDQDKKAPDRTYARRGAFLSPYAFNPLEWGIAPNDLEATDTSQLLGMVVAQMALTDAGYGPKRAFDKSRVSCIMGITGTLELVIPLGARLGHPIWKKALADAGVEAGVAADVMDRIQSSYVGWQENSFPGLLGNVVAGRIANRLNLGGTNCVVDAACASSLSALHLATMELAAGRSDMVVTGGVDTFNDIFMYMCFSKTPALSPTGDARPFAADADGTILGEGLGALILKRLADAERDGDRVHAVIKGIGTSSDGKGQAIYAPSASGQERCLRSAYAEAGVEPASIDLVEGHGTGTKVGDAVEVSALRSVFGAAPDGAWCALGSVKSQIGHTKAAAGVAGLIKAALALEHAVIPPTIKVSLPAEGLAGSALYLPREARPWLRRGTAPRRAAVSAFGFGGSNFHCVLEEAPERLAFPVQRYGRSGEAKVLIVPFGEVSVEALKTAVRAEMARGEADWQELRRMAAGRRRSFERDAEERLVLVVAREDRETFGALLERALRLLDGESFAASGANKILRGSGAPLAAAQVAVMFPGQGAQATGMLRELACDYPEFRQSLEAANRAVQELAPDARRLSDDLYPTDVWSEDDRARAEARLTATERAQAAIGAVSAGAWAVLRGLGLEPGLAFGHSFGELCALHAAGVLDLEGLARAAAQRGAAMAAGGGELGTMLAVSAAKLRVEAALAAACLTDVVIANDNAPEQVVLAGTRAAIEAARAELAKQKFACTSLNVSAAFHSPLVAGAATPFAAFLAGEPFAQARIPVLANTTAAAYPEAPEAMRTLLAQQLAEPVRFVELVLAAYDRGARLFVEIGPGARLCGLVRRILPERGARVTALDAKGEGGGTLALARLVAELAAAGVALALERWDAAAAEIEAPPAVTKKAMTVPLAGANFVRPERRVGRPPVVKAAAPVPAAPSTRSIATSTPVASSPQPVVAKVVPRAAAVPASSSVPVPHFPTTVGPIMSNEQTQLTRETVLALQKIQEQSAQLHREFLEGQRETQRLLVELLSGAPSQGRGLAAGAAQARLPAAPVLQAQAPFPVATRPAPVAPQTVSPSVPYAPPIRTGSTATPPRGAPQAESSFAPSPAPRPTPAAKPVPSAATPPKTSGSAATAATILAVIAEKTGYPTDMLELGMSLEGDLGIDSIKRVEIFSEMSARLPAAAAIPTEELTRLKTLAEIVAAVDQGAPEGESQTAYTPAAPPSAAPADGMATSAAALIAVIAEKTGYPTDMLELGMSLEGDLGIDSIKRVEIFSALQETLPEARALPPEILSAAKTLAEIVAALDALGGRAAPNAAVAKAEALHPATPSAPRAAAPVDRYAVDVTTLTAPPAARRPEGDDAPFFVVASQDDFLAGALTAELGARGFKASLLPLASAWDTLALPPRLAGLILVAPETAPSDARALVPAFAAARRLLPQLAASTGGAAAVFATVTRLGGRFGIDSGPDINDSLFTAGLGGLAKSAAWEWPALRCIALDVEPEARAAAAVADELTTARPASRPVEIGWAYGVWHTTALTRVDLMAEEAREVPQITPGALVVVTGGARGVTAAVADRLALLYQPHFLVLGRSAAPEIEPEGLRGLVAEPEVKNALVRANGGRMTPRELKEAYDRVVADREMRATFAKLEGHGAQVTYRAVDVRDRAAVAQKIAAAQALHGPVRMLVHGAGVLHDRLIVNKTPEQVEAVLGTKLEGLAALLAAVDPDALDALVLFASSTGRFGRKGQADYAVANEALAKLAWSFQRRHPRCRTLALDWGPWDGGMVHSGLKKLFASEGIETIGLNAGAACVTAELQRRSDGPAELVILGAGSRAPGPSLVAEPEASAETPREAFRLPVSVAELPVLADHVLNGRAVLPAALMMEFLALAATQRHPGLTLAGFEDFRVLRGLTLGAEERVALIGRAGPLRREADGLFVTTVELVSEATDSGPLRHHAHAVAILAQTLAPARPAELGAPLGSYPRTIDAAYAEVLFHGAAMQLLAGVTGLDETGIAAALAPEPLPSAWLASPPRATWLTAPGPLDAAFQLMILWSAETLGAVSLPAAVRRFRRHAGGKPVAMRLRLRQTEAARAVADVEALDLEGRAVLTLEGIEATIEPSLAAAFRRNRLAAPERGAARP